MTFIQQQHVPSDPALQIDALDGVRGLAVLIVLFGHFSIQGMDLLPGLDFSGVGKVGVWLFFVLSAFLLTRPFLLHPTKDLYDRNTWIHYFARRFLRIFPLYSFMLVVSYLSTTFTGLGIPFSISGAELISHLFLQAGKSILWSIPPEFVFYFFLPLVALTFIAVKRNVASAFALIVIGGALSTALWPASLAVCSAFILGPYLPIFFLGSLSALTHTVLEKKGAAGGMFRYAFEAMAWMALLVVGATVPAVFNSLFRRQVPIEYFHGEVIFFGVVWSVFLLGVLQGTGFCGRIFRLKPLRYLGLISFSVYLWHWSIIKIVKSFSPFAPGINAWIALTLSVLIASGTYFTIERPCMKIFSGRRAPGASGEPR